MTNQDEQSGRPAADADWIVAAAEAFEHWRKARDMKELARAAGILKGASQRMIMDPERAELAFRIAEELMHVSIAQARPDILDYAIEILERETGFVPHELDPRSVALLAICHAALLSERFYLSRRLEDLAAALRMYEVNASFIETCPDWFEDHDRAWFWWGFGKTHWKKFDVAPQRLELVAAESCLDKALAAEPADSPFSRQIRGDLALLRVDLALVEVKLRAAGGLDPTPEFFKSLDAAIESLQGLTRSDQLSGDPRQMRQNLANLLLQRSKAWPPGDPHRIADMREALAACEEGLALRAASEWESVMLLCTRADCHRLLADNHINPALETAYVAAVECARRTEHPEMLTVASNWALLLSDAGRWQDAAAVGDIALSLLDKLVRNQPDQYYKQAYLRHGVGLAEATAVARAHTGDAAGAITCLERTLAVVWRERYFGPRSLANRLRAAGAPELAGQYLDLIARARAINAPDAELRKAEGQLAQLQSSIDTILGSTGASHAEVIAPAGGTRLPSLYLVTSKVGSLALLRESDGRATVIELPLAPAATVYSMSARFRADVVSGKAAIGVACSTAEETVATLEHAVLGPIEGRILALLAGHDDTPAGSTALDRAPRALAVVTAGPFAGLPLHAARLGDGRPGAALGFAYAPTLGALDEAVPGLDLAASVLIVADPAREGRTSLGGAVLELQNLSRTWPDAHVLSEAAATRSAVLAALPTASLIHLACHGMSDDRDPLDSLVVLADGNLKMSDVLSIQLRPGCVVVLSACQTAVRDPSVPNEAMSLAMGFLAAGAATVVASLWPVADDSTAALMGAFHEALRSGQAPAHALGAAQSAMAAGKLVDPSQAADWRSPFYWAGFVATGR
jgi:hypothetical protein